MQYRIAGLGLFLGVHALAAATLTGTVINSTTGQPAAGDQVLLIAVASGRAAVSGRSVTDSGGCYRFTIDGPADSRAVRVMHQGVGYQKPVPDGAKEVDLRIYDAAEKLEGVTAISYLERLQAQGGKLGVVDEITVLNASDPPRTLAAGRPFEIHLPAGAEVIDGRAARPGGSPAISKPIPSGQSGRYYFPAPLLPGETRFAVAWQVPYQGEAQLEPRISFPVERLTVQFPKSMKFEGKVPGMFQPKPEQGELQVAEAVNPAQAPAFRIRGTGALAKLQPRQPATPNHPATAAGGVQRTAGVKPNPVPRYRWFVMVAAALVLAGGAAGLFARKRKYASLRQSSIVIQPVSSSH